MTIRPSGLTYHPPGERLNFVKAALAAGIALAALAIAPNADAAKRGSIYDVTKATGFERVLFTGDQNGGCELYGVCGYSGEVDYTIGGKPKGTLLVTRSKSGKVEGRATYKSKGLTTTRVSPPSDQSGPDCTQTIAHNTDTFDIFTRGSRNNKMMFVWHVAGPDYLDTKCGGPNEGAVSDADVHPEAFFDTKDFFDGTQPSFAIRGATPFRAGGFTSTIKYKLQFKMKARECSPRCRLPNKR
jgi:hypothetical protein